MKSVSENKLKNLCVFLISLCLVFAFVWLFVLLAQTEELTSFPDESTGIASSGPTLEGADEIYPRVMVNNALYEWHRGSGILSSLPEGCSYYGVLCQTEAECPEEDGQFVAAFSASGEIYTCSADNECIYLILTTSWLNDSVVQFDLSTQ